MERASIVTAVQITTFVSPPSEEVQCATGQWTYWTSKTHALVAYS
jgi:hypothetical protein